MMKKHLIKWLILSGCLLIAGCSSLSGRSTMFKQAEYFGSGREWRMDPIVADINGDGFEDILATHRTPLHQNSLHIWLGAADASFSEVAQVWGSPGYSALAVGDINSDGRMDIVAASHFNKVHTYLAGESFGKFKESVMPAADGYVKAALVDLNGDKRLELVLLGNERAGVQIFKWDDAGKWTLIESRLSGHIGRDMKIADMNNDSRPDIAVSMAKLGVVLILQDLNGQWRETAPLGFVSASGEFRSIDIADINSDGWQDVVLNGGYAGILKPNGPDAYLSTGADGGWRAAGDGLKVMKKPAEGIAVADFNYDRCPDFVAGGNRSGELTEKGFGLFLFLGDCKGNWQLVEDSGLPASGFSRAYGIAARDVNGDGVTDLVVVHGDPELRGGGVSVWYGADAAEQKKGPRT